MVNNMVTEMADRKSAEIAESDNIVITVLSVIPWILPGIATVLSKSVDENANHPIMTHMKSGIRKKCL